MVKITLEVEGMACGMCEAHVNDAIRKAFPVKKVTSSHTKGKTEILAENPLDEEKLKSVLAATGYTVRSAETAPYVKRGFSLLGKSTWFHRTFGGDRCAAWTALYRAQLGTAVCPELWAEALRQSCL